MTTTQDEERGHALDLADSSQAGVYFVTDADLDVLHGAATDAGITVHRIGLAHCTGKASLLQALATGFEFPDGIGRNWDALSDALSDLGWLPPALSRAVLLDDAGALLEGDQQAFDTLLEILEECAAGWRDAGSPFWVFLAMPEAEFDDDSAEADEPGTPPHSLH